MLLKSFNAKLSCFHNMIVQILCGLKALYCSLRLLYVQKVACQNLFIRRHSHKPKQVLTVQSILPQSTGYFHFQVHQFPWRFKNQHYIKIKKNLRFEHFSPMQHLLHYSNVVMCFLKVDKPTVTSETCKDTAQSKPRPVLNMFNTDEWSLMK